MIKNSQVDNFVFETEQLCSWKAKDEITIFMWEEGIATKPQLTLYTN